MITLKCRLLLLGTIVGVSLPLKATEPAESLVNSIGTFAISGLFLCLGICALQSSFAQKKTSLTTIAGISALGLGIVGLATSIEQLPIYKNCSVSRIFNPQH